MAVKNIVDISFVIPAFNEEKSIVRTIESIKAAVGGKYYFEIIVVDNYSTDRTVAICEANDVVVVISTASTIASLRNYGVKKSSGLLLVFIDADIELDACWGGQLGKYYAEIVRCSIVGGSRCYPSGEEGIFYSSWFLPLREKASDNYVGTAHMLVSRCTFDKVGGFDDLLPTGEDYEFCERAIDTGATIKNYNGLVVTHFGFPDSVSKFIRREAWHGEGDVTSVKAFIKSPVNLMCVLFCVQVAVGVVGVFTNTWLFVSAAILMGVFLYVISRIKFSTLSAKNRVTNLFILILYILGRTLSWFNLGKRVR